MTTSSRTLSSDFVEVPQSTSVRQSSRQSSRLSSRSATLTDAPRWLLLAALVYAPWAYGCTRAWAGNTLAVVLGIVVLLWLVDCMARRHWPAIPGLLLLAVFGLLAQGWWMALNAKSSFDPDH